MDEIEHVGTELSKIYPSGYADEQIKSDILNCLGTNYSFFKTNCTVNRQYDGLSLAEFRAEVFRYWKNVLRQTSTETGSTNAATGGGGGKPQKTVGNTNAGKPLSTFSVKQLNNELSRLHAAGSSAAGSGKYASKADKNRAYKIRKQLKTKTGNSPSTSRRANGTDTQSAGGGNENGGARPLPKCTICGNNQRHLFNDCPFVIDAKRIKQNSTPAAVSTTQAPPPQPPPPAASAGVGVASSGQRGRHNPQSLQQILEGDEDELNSNPFL
jgi:hypothetical protein